MKSYGNLWQAMKSREKTKKNGKKLKRNGKLWKTMKSYEKQLESYEQRSKPMKHYRYEKLWETNEKLATMSETNDRIRELVEQPASYGLLPYIPSERFPKEGVVD